MTGFRKWADSIGINTSKVVDAILTSGRIEQQSYRSCMGLQKLQKIIRQENWSRSVLRHFLIPVKPSYKSIKNLLAAEKNVPDTEPEASQGRKTTPAYPEEPDTMEVNNQTNQSTIDKLIEMRLTAMADAFRIQMDDPTMKEVPFEDRFGMLCDVEYSNRKNNRLKRADPPG